MWKTYNRWWIDDLESEKLDVTNLEPDIWNTRTLENDRLEKWFLKWLVKWLGIRKYDQNYDRNDFSNDAARPLSQNRSFTTCRSLKLFCTHTSNNTNQPQHQDHDWTTQRADCTKGAKAADDNRNDESNQTLLQSTWLERVTDLLPSGSLGQNLQRLLKVPAKRTCNTIATENVTNWKPTNWIATKTIFQNQFWKHSKPKHSKHWISLARLATRSS